MKMTAITRLASHPSYGGVSIGNRLKLIADQDLTYSDDCNNLFGTGSSRWEDNGKLIVDNSVFTFCYSAFAKIFKTKVAAIKAKFIKDTIYKVRITIEVLEEEEWEYTK